jgi:tetratricopeptide (TPR) repeat protein
MRTLIIIASVALVALVAGDSYPRGPGGRPAGGGARPAGGGARPANHPTPSFSGHPPVQQHAANHPNNGGHPGFVPHNQQHPNQGTAQHPNQPNNNQSNRQNVNTGNQFNRQNVNTGNQFNRQNVNTGNQFNRQNVNTGNQFNRQNINTGNQWNNRNNNNTINNNSGNRTVNNSYQPTYNNNSTNFNRPAGYNYYRGNWAGWHGGYWNNWNYRPAAWVGAGAAGVAGGSWLLSGNENYTYSNPFYVSSPNVTVQALDYSQPIPVPAAQPDPPPTDDGSPPPPADPPPVPEDASRNVDAARAAFKAGDYPRAQALVEKAIAALPDDSTLHEFRALTLFAQKNYKDAASAVYAVLSVGPGWNWDTMKSFYPAVDVYTRQLRALEDYVKANPKYADGHFLLAYHYLVLTQSAAAVKQLQLVMQLMPNDKLCPQLIKAFAPPAADQPKPQAP